jgi:hypothetical protein
MVRDFPLLQSMQINPETHPDFYPMCTLSWFTRDKAAGVRSWPLPPSMVEVKDMWSYTSTPSHGNKSIFYFYLHRTAHLTVTKRVSWRLLRNFKLRLHALWVCLAFFWPCQLMWFQPEQVWHNNYDKVAIYSNDIVFLWIVSSVGLIRGALE